MWLNILSFVLASMLVKTRVAKRFALWFVIRFGKNATMIIFSFLIINIVLSAFISATTAKATILLPIFMVVAAIYGARGGDNRNNFGRNLVLQNLFQINIGASGFITGSGANLLAGSIIAGAMGWTVFSYQDWFVAAFPLAIILMVIGWFVGSKLIFPLKKNENGPQIEGGIERLKEEFHKLGKMSFDEYKAIFIFVSVLVLWATDKQHGIDQTAVAFMGAVVSLLPGIGIVKWNDIDIPWHLLLFSAGAYTLGAGLDATDLPVTIVDVSFTALGIDASTPFWLIYAVLTALMIFSALLFQSKTMRALIFIPIAIGVAQKFGMPILSLSFPLALLIEHVYVLPFNSKPAALLYTTNHYSWSDTFKFGMTMMIISWIMILIWGETVLKWLGYTSGLF
jgi:anion transporter